MSQFDLVATSRGHDRFGALQFERTSGLQLDRFLVISSSSSLSPHSAIHNFNATILAVCFGGSSKPTAPFSVPLIPQRNPPFILNTDPNSLWIVEHPLTFILFTGHQCALLVVANLKMCLPNPCQTLCLLSCVIVLFMQLVLVNSYGKRKFCFLSCSFTTIGLPSCCALSLYLLANVLCAL